MLTMGSYLLRSGRLRLTERGTCIGYNTLVVDCYSFTELQAWGLDGCPWITMSRPGADPPDGPNMVPMHRLEALLRQLMAIRPAVADGIVLCPL